MRVLNVRHNKKRPQPSRKVASEKRESAANKKISFVTETWYQRAAQQISIKRETIQYY